MRHALRHYVKRAHGSDNVLARVSLRTTIRDVSSCVASLEELIFRLLHFQLQYLAW